MNLTSVLLTGIVAGSMAVSTNVNALTFDLSGTIRDFNDTHADFESTVGGLDTGAVLSTLGGDGKPVYNAAGAGSAFHGPANFNQWYNDVGGVNQSAPLTITLDNMITADPNVYSFVSGAPGFFPIDGQLFGNQGPQGAPRSKRFSCS